MKKIREFILVAVIGALLALPAIASATTVTSSEGSTPTFKGGGGPIVLHPGSGSSFLSVTCQEVSGEGMIQTHGSGVTAAGVATEVEIKDCGNDIVTVLKTGSVEIHSISPTGDGTMTSSGAEIRIHTSEGPVCTFKTAGTDVGVLKGGTPAILKFGSAIIPASGFLCPSTGILTGEGTITSPSTVEVH